MLKSIPTYIFRIDTSNPFSNLKFISNFQIYQQNPSFKFIPQIHLQFSYRLSNLDLKLLSLGVSKLSVGFPVLGTPKSGVSCPGLGGPNSGVPKSRGPRAGGPKSRDPKAGGSLVRGIALNNPRVYIQNIPKVVT